MLDVLQFIFSSFWVWLGTVVLLYSFGDILVTTVKVIAKRKRDSATKSAGGGE